MINEKTLFTPALKQLLQINFQIKFYPEKWKPLVIERFPTVQGGGWCYDNTTCEARLKANGWGTGKLVSSNNWANTVKVSGRK